MERENFKSRLGFLLISAGCAIGIGNVWRFPYMVGNNGGGVFVLFYILFLIILGVPILSMEFAVGRASRKSAVCAFKLLEKPGQKWHFTGYLAVLGNYFLMMFYTTVSGWMLYYFYATASGEFVGTDTAGVASAYANLLESPLTMAFWMIVVVIAGSLICSFGLQKGVEKVSKGLMLALFGIMIILAINSILLSGSNEGLSFYLIPDFAKVQEIGIGKVIVVAMSQSFFTLSLGIGCMTIFGSYLNKDKKLAGESLSIALLDTFVAIVAGLIIFPACFAFGVNPDSGPGLIFITLPNVFNAMMGGRIWGSLFFLFMSFAAFSTIIGVFENIISFSGDLWNWSRKKAAWVNIGLMILLSMPCVLGFNLWKSFQPLGEGSNVLSLEDFAVSNILLPLGALLYVLFCTHKKGWGWKAYSDEANTGSGINTPKWLYRYCKWVLPLVILGVFVYGMITFFQ